MKLQTIEIEGVTYAQVQDGKPVFVADDGKQIAFDAPGTTATIARLNRENQANREAKDTAETALKAFEGITDPAAAKKALATVSALDEKSLIAAGDRDAAIAAAIKAKEDEFRPFVEKADKLEKALNAELIGGGFARSKFAAEKLAIPSDIAEARFGSAFKIEDGRPVAYGPDGNKLYSKARPGEVASFDEAFEMLVDLYPNKNSILKGTGNSGTGAEHSGPGGGGGKVLTTAQFDALSPAEQMTKMETGFTVAD